MDEPESTQNEVAAGEAPAKESKPERATLAEALQKAVRDTSLEPPSVEAPAAAAETPEALASEQSDPRGNGGRREGQRRENRPPREGGAPRPEGGGSRGEGHRERRAPGGPGGVPGGDRGRGPGGERGGDRGGHGDRGERRPGGGPGGRPFDFPMDIELEKLIADSLYLDNQAHAVVARMRDIDSGTKSQLRRLYNAVRRAVRAPEGERQHQFVMLRARLAYTIARHSLRSLDALERLLLQVTRRNDARGYERFKDLFEAIVAYNE
jgi:CRISPR type III-A-associated protein Csm2